MKRVPAKYGDKVRVTRPRRSVDIIVSGNDDSVSVQEVASAVASSGEC